MPLSWNEIRTRAADFAREYADAADERSQAQTFWIDFFNVFGVRKPRVASFEHAVKKHGGGQGFIDLFWPGVLLIEHKSRGKNLERAHDQAMAYFPGLKERDLPRYVLVSDFCRLRLFDLEAGTDWQFPLSELPKQVRRFAFIAGYSTQDIRPQDPVNQRAAEKMGALHDAMKAGGYTGHALEVFLVRLLFCLFADDTGIFEPAQSFRSWIEDRTAEDGSDLGGQLAQLWQVLNTPHDKRHRQLDEQLAAFAYVNGGLFAEQLPLASFDRAMREQLLDCCALDWSAISPAIFGAMFQSIMDAAARRNLGAHYTSEENILKLIKPLFLDALWHEFHQLKGQRNRLFEFHKKLRSLTFLDPACGCGNFLVITYRELRLLELEVLRAAYSRDQRALDVHHMILVDVDQFHGIEVEEFPAQIAQVALWLIDHQMNQKVGDEFGQHFARIPLRATPHVLHANALRIDWNDVLPARRCAFVLGNPPFVGAKYMDDAQRGDAARVFAEVPNAGLLDFVAAWYVKAAHYLRDALPAHPRVAFVSTNSICQGEQVGVLWSWLLAQGVHIHFAHRTFQWRNEARGVAAVHCVIVGFGLDDVHPKTLFEYEDMRGEPHALPAAHINPYLVDAPDVLLQRRSTPLCDVPVMRSGNKPIDDGNFLFTPEQRKAFIAEEPASKPYFRRWLGGEEFLNGTERWYLLLRDCEPAELRAMPAVRARVQAVQRFRAASRSAPTRALATTPTRFHTEFIAEGKYIAMPQVSSERRDYVPFAFLDKKVLCGDKLRVVDHATPYHFGVLTSHMHMAWMRAVCGRLKSDYQYSALIVYNNFPWPDPTPAQRQAIADAAQGVLDARAAHPGATLADLYDPLAMPANLRRAHQALDKAVDAAYAGRRRFAGDAERVSFLFSRYLALTDALPVAAAPGRRAAARRRLPATL